MVRRQRLGAEDVEHRGADLAAVERGEEVILGEMPAAPHIDHSGALRHQREGACIEDALGRLGQRQEADDDVAARQERREAVGAVEGSDAGDRLPAAAPAGDVETERSELQRGVGAEEVLAVQAEHLGEDIFAHRRHHVRIDQAHDRHVARQSGVIENMIDPGAERGDQLEVGQGGEDAVRRLPHQRHVDRRGVADFGIDAKIEVRHETRELRLPALRVGARRTIEEGEAHVRTA